MIWIAFILTTLAVVLQGRKSNWCWAATLLACLVWSIYAASTKQTALLLQQVVVAGLAINGWRCWRKPNPYTTAPAPTTKDVTATQDNDPRPEWAALGQPKPPLAVICPHCGTPGCPQVLCGRPNFKPAPIVGLRCPTCGEEGGNAFGHGWTCYNYDCDDYRVTFGPIDG